VATQELTATVSNTTVEAQGGLVGGIHLGDANASVGSTNGIAQTAANSGAGGIVQQGLAMATAAPVKF
jgi:hypothetical protein